MAILLCEGESDTWCASVSREIWEMGVLPLGLPSGAAARPRAEWVEQLTGQTLILGLDSDKAGKAGRSRWITAMDGKALLYLPKLGDGQDLSEAPDLVMAVRESQAVDPAAAQHAAEAAALGESGEEMGTDSANSSLFADRNRHRLRWVDAWGEWVGFDGKRWRRKAGSLAKRHAKETARYIFLQSMERGLPRPATAEKSSSMSAMLTWAEPDLAEEPDVFDQDPWLLNCQNGTLDLRTGTLRPASPDDMITAVTPVDYNPAAKSDVFQAFLNSSVPDPADQDYLQRVAGYCLAGVATEDKFVFLFGPSGSGKSTTAASLVATLGPDYARTGDVSMFLASQRERSANDASPALAALAGKRLVTVSEPDPEKRWDIGMIKKVTGGEELTARFLNKNDFNFPVQFTLMVTGNNRPVVQSDPGDALRRRLREIPFPYAAGAKEDEEIRNTLVNPRLSGEAILAWAVEGCLKWQKQPLGDHEPASVTQATEENWEEQESNNPVRAFLSDYYTKTLNFDVDRVPRPSLHEHFEKVTHSGMSSARFTKEVEGCGFASVKSSGTWYWKGMARLHPVLNWEVALDGATPTVSDGEVTE